jgi:hypothetical protein
MSTPSRRLHASSSRPSRPRPAGSARATALAAAAGLAVLVVTGCGGPDALNGTLRTADTRAKGGSPLAGGWVAVLTAEQAADFFDQSGIDQPNASGLAVVEGRVRHEAIAETGGTLLAVHDDGTFTTTATGPRQVCVLREFPQVDVLRGCAAVDLPATGRLDLTVGADGVAATLRH